ncbi:MAG: hypothetical protein ABIR15_20960 [Chitinophagaceae bacterium]
MIRKIPVKGLMEPWRKNFTDNVDLPFVTEASSVSMDVLNEFLSEAKKSCPGFNGLRIYFIRYDTVNDGLTGKSSHIKLIPGKKVSQVSLAIVPIKNFDPVTLQGDDYTDGDTILTLSFCHPSLEDGENGWAIGTGHCPPVCVPDKPRGSN